MADHRDDFKLMLPLHYGHALLAKGRGEDAQFDEYFRLFAKDREWEGEVEILVVARCYHVAIEVHEDSGSLRSYSVDITHISVHIAYSRKFLQYYSTRDDDQAFPDAANMDVIHTEAPISEDQCSEIIADDDTNIRDTTFSSHHTNTIESSAEEPASVAPP